MTLPSKAMKKILTEHMHFDSEYNLGNAYFKTQAWGTRDFTLRTSGSVVTWKFGS